MAAPAIPRPKTRRRYGTLIARIAIGVVFLGFWEFASGRLVKEFIVSRPTVIIKTLFELLASGELWYHAQVTLAEFAVGFPLGCVLGILVGYVLGMSPTLSGIFEPYVVALYSVPRIALGPLFIIWLGIGIWSKVGLIILMTFFVTFFNTYAGVKSMSQELLDLARLMGASERALSYRVILPAISPYIMVGLKMAVAQGVLGAIVGEFIAAFRGVGFYIQRAAQLFHAEELFAGILIILALAAALNALFSWVERRLMAWQPNNERGMVG